ncbi:MAG: glycosyltransferase family 4 protein [Planctomycetales bacterium]|nr:glycosyltransferase family 4 protein [Planctomycetales bacterium]
MKIAFVRLQAGPLLDENYPGDFGGAEVRAYTFAKQLAETSGHEISFVVHGDPQGDARVHGLLNVVRIPSEKSALQRASWRKVYRGPVRFWQKLRRSFAKRWQTEPRPWDGYRHVDTDLVAVFGVHNPAAAVISAARRQGHKSILFLTSDDDARRALMHDGKRGRDVAEHRWALLHADAVVVQTEFQRRAVRRAGQHAVLIRNPIVTRTDCGPMLAMDERRYLLWVGRADVDSKRADLCLQLARECPDVPFVMIMNPTEPQLTARLKTNVPANVKLIDRVDFQASETFYRHALALVNTSQSEGFPNAFLQAAKHGVPILSRRVDPDYVLTSHGLGFVAQDSMERLAEMARTVFHEPFRFEAVAKRARRYVVDHHDLTSRTEELRAVCEAVVAGTLSVQRQQTPRKKVA